MFISILDTHGHVVYVNTDNVLKITERQEEGCALTLVGDISVYTKESVQSVIDQIHKKAR